MVTGQLISTKHCSGCRKLPKPPPSLWPAQNCDSREAVPPGSPQDASVDLSSSFGLGEAELPEGTCRRQTRPQVPREEKNSLAFSLVSRLAGLKGQTSVRRKTPLLLTVQGQFPGPPPCWPQCISACRERTCQSGCRNVCWAKWWALPAASGFRPVRLTVPLSS